VRPLRTRGSLVLSGLLLLAAACGGNGSPNIDDPSVAGSSPSTFPVTITDDDGVDVTIASEPRRIITFAPSATEIVFALGLGDRLVGVSGPFDDFPPEAADIQEVGGAGDFGVDPNIEQVVSLEPDLFLTIKGGEQWKGRLRDLGVPVFTLDATDLDDLLADLEVAGRITGATEQASVLVAEMRAEADAIEDAVGALEPVTCFYETFYPPLNTVGPGAFIYDLLERGGCDPVTSSADQPYAQWSVEDVVDQDPDVYLVSSESGASARAVARRAGFEAIDAVANGRVEPIDADLAERPGPRIVEGLRLIAQALHPEAFD
jgi:iron complex transport system substrate-binding protein